MKEALGEFGDFKIGGMIVDKMRCVDNTPIKANHKKASRYEQIGLHWKVNCSWEYLRPLQDIGLLKLVDNNVVRILLFLYFNNCPW